MVALAASLAHLVELPNKCTTLMINSALSDTEYGRQVLDAMSTTSSNRLDLSNHTIMESYIST